MWDSGSGKNGEKTATADFMSNMIKSLPPLHDVAKMAGLDLPEYLGSVKGAEPVTIPALKSPKQKEEKKDQEGATASSEKNPKEGR